MNMMNIQQLIFLIHLAIAMKPTWIAELQAPHFIERLEVGEICNFFNSRNCLLSFVMCMM